jgi:hypothetical protein
LLFNLKIKKINNSVNANGRTLSILVKLNPLNISNIPIKKILIRFEPTIDCMINIEIIKKNNNFIFFSFENKDRANKSVYKIFNGTLKNNRGSVLLNPIKKKLNASRKDVTMSVLITKTVL